MKTISVGGSYYMMIVTDARSRMRYVYFLTKKDEALEDFKEYHIMAEMKTGQKLMAVRSDNGGKFVNGEFRKYFKNHGIEQQLIAPYTPQEVGVSEVSNRIIIGKANTILHAANAPKSLCTEAIMTAVQLTNIIPSKGSQASNEGLDGINTTPYEIWYGRKSQVGHL
jgi:transposase InsO family protein